MANRGRVRAHPRRKPGGGTTRVGRHNRATRGRKPPPLSYKHGWQLLKRAHKAGKRKKKLLSFTLGVLGLGEIAGMLTLDTARAMFLTLTVVGIAGAIVTSLATGRT